MPNIDISRDATDPRKHYHGVRMQQGRVLTDDDFNEATRLSEEDARRAIVDTIGSAGSPDDGFKLVPNKDSTGLILSLGTFYVGGHRLEIEKNPDWKAGGDPDGEQFNHQKDWLQQGTSDQLPTIGSGYDFVYLEVWEQPVTAVEDYEILEMALGGPDTSARVRTMRRARALKLSTPGTPSCEDGWKTLNSSPYIQSLGSLGDSCGSSSDGGGDYCMVTTNATLTVASNTSGPQGDLCSPEPNGGYLGAENQAIRVQITTDSTNPSGLQFIWGFDNGSSLYRVQLLIDSFGNPVLDKNNNPQINMLTVPKDGAHWLVDGQIVEFLPWSAVLSNGEKCAELTGAFATVSQNYDPSNNSCFSITDPGTVVSMLKGNPFGSSWKASDLTTLHNALPVVTVTGATETISGGTTTENPFFYMRVWNRGGDTSSMPSSPTVITDAGNTNYAANLIGTGLQVTFSGGPFNAGDFWIIAARPNTPSEVVPWELTTGRKPNGVRRWIAPLGIIEWTGTILNVVTDCRPTFVPLTLSRGCCTYTVGDGMTSQGQYCKIQDAIDALPVSGGEICLLPGTYNESNIHPTKIHLNNVKIHGCGQRSIVQAPDSNPVFNISNIDRIVMENLKVVTGTGDGIDFNGAATEAILDRLTIDASTGAKGVSLPNNSQLNSLIIKECKIRGGNGAAVDIEGGNIATITKCALSGGGVGAGVNINGGNSLSVIYCAITGGIAGGNNVPSGYMLNVADCEIKGGISAGIDIETCARVDIRRNRISECKGGIFISSAAGNASISDCEVISNSHSSWGINIASCPCVEIHRTRISGGIKGICINDALNAPNSGLPGFGSSGSGIASGIVSGGGGYNSIYPPNAVSVIISDCDITGANDTGGGILIGRVSGVDIHGNRITGGNLGISILGALTPDVWNGLPAARIFGNIVSNPSGLSLSMVALGAVSIQGNQFSTNPSASGLAGVFLPSAVYVLNLGISNELNRFFRFADLRGIHSQLPDLPNNMPLPNGNVLFSGNQIMLNATAGVSETPMATLIASLDDISFQDNQCDCVLPAGASPSLCADVVLAGFSVRVATNRMKESPPSSASLSGITFGRMNATTNNQGTHCFAAYCSDQSYLVDEGNRVLFDNGCCGFALSHGLETGFFNPSSAQFGEPASVDPIKTLQTTIQTGYGQLDAIRKQALSVVGTGTPLDNAIEALLNEA